jgi:hypothetical protein
MNAKDFARQFKRRWEGEIRDQVELGQCDSALVFWDMSIAAKIDDGDLPETARKWTPPAWLVRLEKVAVRNDP